MRISIFGASGFIGYNFVRHVLDSQDKITPTVYSTSAASLTNILRHDLDVQIVHYGQLQSCKLDSETRYLVNFAHPFGIRDGLKPRHQLAALLAFFQRQLESLPLLKLVHVSSMSVYEPFAAGHEFTETDFISPPRHDTYARNKADIDKKILSWTSAQNRILLLRPTIVYGPFGGPWTDNIIKQFRSGPVSHTGLRGRIQPVWVSDISRLVMRGLNQFVPGVINVAGPESMHWKAFCEFFEGLAEAGELIQIAGMEPTVVSERVAIAQRCKNAASKIIANTFIREVATPFLRPLPDSIKLSIKTKLGLMQNEEPDKGARLTPGPFCREFFNQDRLVSISKLGQEFPDFSLTRLSDVIDDMRSYTKFRFSDGLFW